ncbi:hypothetical protein [Bradyrhizobium jicamae]|uniref:hypothetical protein n=1 Tax=Bradyrhizobium jicamae TaxID=280332 RepID=UPI001BA804A6|nr:hypothetical protein [Bradyrhizobium jicamae]MBR0934866.1 hypothetical protein [Bradyrhizobium jicamae]
MDNYTQYLLDQREVYVRLKAMPFAWSDDYPATPEDVARVRLRYDEAIAAIDIALNMRQ